MKTLTVSDFDRIGVCSSALQRIAGFGGSIENSQEGWAAYIKQYPQAWIAPIYTAQAYALRGELPDSGMVWKLARIAIREYAIHGLMYYASELGPHNAIECMGRTRLLTGDVGQSVHQAVWYAHILSTVHNRTAASHAFSVARIAAHVAYLEGGDSASDRVKQEMIDLAVLDLMNLP